MWDGHLGSFMVMQHRIDLEKTDRRPIHPTSHWAGRKASKFQNQKINQVLAINFIGQREQSRPQRSSSSQAGTKIFALALPSTSSAQWHCRVRTNTIHGRMNRFAWRCDHVAISDANGRYLAVKTGEENREETALTSHQYSFPFHPHILRIIECTWNISPEQ